MIWWFIIVALLGLGAMEFLTRYRIERLEEEPVVLEDLYGRPIVEANTIDELIAELEKLPKDTDVTKLWIVPKEPLE